MARDILKERESAFEYEFFHRVDTKLLAALRKKLDEDERRAGLAKCTGISDESVLQELAELGISSETIMALALMPLVHIAWADSTIDERERAAILNAAMSLGLDREAPSCQLLDLWMQECPDEKVFTAWKDYVRGLAQTMSPVSRYKMQRDLIEKTRRVAKAAGGFLGMHRVSRAEGRTLAELETVFEENPTS